MVEHDSSPLKWLGTLFTGVNQPNKIKDTKGHELASRVGTTLKSKNSIDFLLLKMLAASLMIFSFPPTSQLPNNSARIGPAKFGGAGPDRPGRNSEFQDVLRRLKLLSKLLPALGSYWLYVILVGNVGRSRKRHKLLQVAAILMSPGKKQLLFSSWKLSFLWQ